MQSRDALQSHLADRLPLQSGGLVRITPALGELICRTHKLGLVPAQLAQVTVVEAQPRLADRKRQQERKRRAAAT